MKNFSKKIFLCLSLLWVGQTFSNIFTDGAQWAKNLYCSSLSKAEHRFGAPQKSLQIGLPTTVVIGLLGYLACPEEDLQKIRDYASTAKWIAIGGATLYGLQWAKRWWNFYALGNSLRDASYVETAHKDKFRYATWKKDRWPLASDLVTNKEAVKKQLKRDVIECEDQVYDDKGNVIDHSIKMTSDNVKTWINKELKNLKNDLCSVGLCTDAHEAVIEFLILHKKATSNNISDFMNIAVHVEYLQNLNQVGLDNLIKRIKKYCKKNYRKRSLLNRIVNFPNYQFWYEPFWYYPPQFAPHYKRATKLYCKLLRHYIRLSAFKSVVDEMSWRVDPNKPKPNQHEIIFPKDD